MDSTFHVLENISKNNEVFFQFESFRFVDETRTSLVYVHCDIIICSTNDPTFEQCINNTRPDIVDNLVDNVTNNKMGKSQDHMLDSVVQKRSSETYGRKPNKNLFKISAATPILKFSRPSLEQRTLTRKPRSSFMFLTSSSTLLVPLFANLLTICQCSLIHI